MIANLKDTYTSDEVRLMMLEEKQHGVREDVRKLSDKIDKIDVKIDGLEKKFDYKIDAIDKKFDAKIDKLYWFLIGLYGTAALALLKPFIFLHY